MGIEVCYLSQLEIQQILAFCVLSNPGWNQKHHPPCERDVSAVFRYSGVALVWVQVRLRAFVLGANCPAVCVCLVRHPAFSGPSSQLCSAYGNHGIQATDKAMYATNYPLTSQNSSSLLFSSHINHRFFFKPLMLKKENLHPLCYGSN